MGKDNLSARDFKAHQHCCKKKVSVNNYPINHTQTFVGEKKDTPVNFTVFPA